MRRRRWILAITAFLLLLMGVVALLLDKTAEPSFKGRTLTEWVADLRPVLLFSGRGGFIVVGQRVTISCTPLGANPASPIFTMQATTPRTFAVDREKHDAAAAAIREIGTNAIPHLLPAVYVRDGRFKTACMKWSQKQKLIKIPWQSAEEHRGRALSALSQLGVQALWAWVEVVTNDMADPEVQVYAAHRLSDLGRQAMPAVPAMLLMDNHRQPRVWSAICSAIQQCEGDCILLYLRYLHWDNPNIRASAAWSLGFCGKYPDMAIPALVRALNDAEPQVRREVVLALGKFGTEAASITNHIQRAMADPDPQIRSAATNTFHRVLGIGATN